MKLFVLTLLFSHHLISVQTGSVAPCPVPDAITNGKVSYTGRNLNDVATYTCRYGYRMDGTANRTCQADNTWNGTLPTCTDIDSYFSFECYVNGSITAVNPDPSSLIWAQATNVNGTCNSAFNSDKTAITIDGCALDNVILLVFSPYDTGIPNVIQNNVKYYNITCMTIPIDGILVVVTDSTWIRNVMSTSREPERTPKVYINSDIGVVDSEFENVTTLPSEEPTLEINDVLRWKLYVPEQYIIQPLNCTAYSGVITELGSQFSMDIIQMGCSLNTELVSDFRFATENITHMMVADIMAFRFPGSDMIEIVCSVKGCPAGSTACDFTCPERERRSVNNKSSRSDYLEIISSPNHDKRYSGDMESSDHDERFSRGVKDTIKKTTTISFRVIGPPNVGLEYLYLFESSSQQQIKQCAVTVIIIMMVGRLFHI